MSLQQTTEELVDIYDVNRIPTGKLHNRREPINSGEYFMVVNVCIFNSKNQMLIQQRQPYKKS